MAIRIAGAKLRKAEKGEGILDSLPVKKRSEAKYGSKKTEVDGITFDSRKEARFYCELRMKKMLGEVKEIELQPTFELQPKYKYQGKTIRAITYRADFKVLYADGKTEVIDVKGFRTDVYLIKKKMLLYKFPDIDFREV